MRLIESFIRLLVMLAYFLSLTNLLFSREIELGKIIAYPNPYSPNTDAQPLTFSRSERGNLVGFSGEIKIIVYDADLVKVYEKEYPASTAGSNKNVSWSGINSNGSRVSSGLYYIRFIESRRDGTSGFKFLKIIVR